MTEAKLNLKDPILAKWIDQISNDTTKNSYTRAFYMYSQFTKLEPRQMINEAIEDAKKDVLERKDIVKIRLLNFYKWLLTEAPRVNNKGEVIGKGTSDKTADVRVQAIRSFYATFDITVKFKGMSKLPKPRTKNKRLKLAPEEVKKLIDYTTTPRDRAIILAIYQGGMDDSTLCSIKYKQVKECIVWETYKHPHKLDLYRKKAGTNHYTFLGRDAVEAIKAYINYLKSVGITLDDEDPLFIRQVFKGETRLIRGIDTWHIQAVLREVAVRAGFITKEQLKQTHHNPVNPHSLRESFSTILYNNGVDKTKIDFMMGHAVNQQDEVYFENQEEKLRQAYASVEKYLSISTASSTVTAVEEQVNTLQKVVEKQAIQVSNQDETINKLAKFVLKFAENNFGDDPKRYADVPEYLELMKMFKELVKVVKPKQ